MTFNKNTNKDIVTIKFNLTLKSRYQSNFLLLLIRSFSISRDKFKKNIIKIIFTKFIKFNRYKNQQINAGAIE
jgi:hypothetical protein